MHPHDDTEDDGRDLLVMHSLCHPDAPTWLIAKPGARAAVLICSTCSAVVVSFETTVPLIAEDAKCTCDECTGATDSEPDPTQN